jgi:MFS family permease
LPLLAFNFPLLLAAFVLLGIGIGALDVSMNAHAVLVEERYGRPIMSSFHGLFSLGGLVGAALAGGAMQVGLPPAPHLVIAAVMLGASALAAWPLLLPIGDSSHRLRGGSDSPSGRDQSVLKPGQPGYGH